jgi:hypothetical protein
MPLPDPQMDDFVAFVSLGRADRAAIQRHLSGAERKSLNRLLTRARQPSSSSDVAGARLAKFSPTLRRTLRKALANSSQSSRVTPATQRVLQTLLMLPQ